MDTNDLIDQTGRRRRRRRGMAALLLSLAVGSLGAGAFSLALFTDTDAATGAFTTGTIDISLNPTALFSATGIMPGSTGSATLRVTNGGTADLRYAVTSTATNLDGKNLATTLQMAVRPGACPSVAATIYNGNVGTVAWGSVVAGPQAGDRALTAGAFEDLCFTWSLAGTTGNGLQGATTTATFTFSAEQTANNP